MFRFNRLMKALFVAIVALVSVNLAWQLARKNAKNNKDDKNAGT